MLTGVIRIILTCIMGILWIILMYTSFFMSQDEQHIKSIEDIIHFSAPEFTATGYVNSFENIWLFENIFSDQKDILYEKSSSGMIFDITKPGKYFSSLRDLRKEYQFHGENIKIKQQWVGEIYFLVHNEKKSVFVFPLNTPLEILLLDENKQEVTKIFLTPHMYAEIDIENIARLKNADALRVQTLLRIWYVASSIGELYENGVLESFQIQKSSFFSQVYDFITSTDGAYRKLISPLKDQQVLEIFWNSLLQKYAAFFVNPEKKEVYHKNEILRGYIELLSIQRYERDKVKNIEEHLNILSQFDMDAYTQMYDLSEKIRFILLHFLVNFKNEMKQIFNLLKVN